MITALYKVPLYLVLLASILAPMPARSQKNFGGTIELDATSGMPMLDVEVSGRPFRLALDPLLGKHLVLNPATARRIGFRAIEGVTIEAGIDEAIVNAAVDRMMISANRRSQWVFGVSVGQPHQPYGVTEPYDLAGGFEALPAGTIIVHLNHDLAGPMREYRFSRAIADQSAGFPITIGETKMRMNVHFANSASWLDRAAAQMLVDESKMRPTGAVRLIPAWFGLQVPVQDVSADRPVTIKGLVVERLQARTPDPLKVPSELAREMIVSRLADRDQPPVLLIGTDTLSRCARMTFHRRSQTLILTCPERAGRAASPQ